VAVPNNASGARTPRLTLPSIDILASKLAFANDAYAGVSSRNNHNNNQKTGPAPRHFTQQGTVNNEMYPLPDVERRIEIIGGGPAPLRSHMHRTTSSQEHIVRDSTGGGGGGGHMSAADHHHHGGDGDDGTATSSHDGGSSPKSPTVVEDIELGINKTVEFAIYETQHRR
jgi:hypothetical protein